MLSRKSHSLTIAGKSAAAQCCAMSVLAQYMSTSACLLLYVLATRLLLLCCSKLGHHARYDLGPAHGAEGAALLSPLCLLRIRCRRTASAICVSRATSVCSKLSTTQGQCRIWEADQLQSPRTRQRMPSAVLTSLGNETEWGVHLCHCLW